MSYDHVFEIIGAPKAILDCYQGRISSPINYLVAPPQWYVFPPALIPIWSEGSLPSYIGYWKHWFLERSITIVEMSVSSGRIVTEIARTEEQLLNLIAARSICNSDGISKELSSFASATNIHNLNEVDNITLETGDSLLGLSRLSTFKEYCPLASCSDVKKYDGEFPSVDAFNAAVRNNTYSTFEIPDAHASSNQASPKWYSADIDKPALFDLFLEDKDHANAWLTLNSTGWPISDARIAISKLAESANSNEFNVLANAWLEMADPHTGSY